MEIASYCTAEESILQYLRLRFFCFSFRTQARHSCTKSRQPRRGATVFAP